MEQPERFTYFEGHPSTLRAIGYGADHAWCVDREGRVIDPKRANLTSDRRGAYLRLPIPLAIVKPYAYFESSGTFDGWLHERPRRWRPS